MVRKGSPVRVRQRALREDPASAGSLLLTGPADPDLAGPYRVRNTGPAGFVRVILSRFWSTSRGPSHASVREWGPSCALSCMDQLQLPLSGPAASPPEFLTIAEAARRVQCCERTIRRAIDSGALRAG